MQIDVAPFLPCTNTFVTLIDGVVGSNFLAPNGQADWSFHGSKGFGVVWAEHLISGVRHLSMINCTTGTVAFSNQGSTIYGTTSTLHIRGLDDSDGGCFLVGIVSAGLKMMKTKTDGTVVYFAMTSDHGDKGVMVDANGDMWARNGPTGVLLRMSNINYTAHTCTDTLATGTPNVCDGFLRNANGIAGRVYFRGASPFPVRYVNTSTMACTEVISAYSGVGGVIGLDGNIYTNTFSGTVTTLHKHDADGNLIASLAFDLGQQRCPKLYDNDGFIWLMNNTGPGSAIKVHAATMQAIEIIPNTVVFSPVAEPFNGRVLFNKTGTGGFAFLECL